MRERLIALLEKFKYDCLLSCKDGFITVKNDCDACVMEQLADYLLANGVIVPPCLVGDKVFYINEICDENANEYLDISVGEVVSFSMQKEGLWAYCRYEDGLTYWHLVVDDFGKTVFLTKEEAEAKLKEGAE